MAAPSYQRGRRRFTFAARPVPRRHAGRGGAQRALTSSSPGDELARELDRAISQLRLALRPATRRHAREYLADDFARALAAGESPDAFMARRKQVFRFLERRASAPADREGRPAPRRMMLEFRVI